MNEASGHTRKLLMHACCGPCSLEPVRILRERGIEPDIYYSNSNIAPGGEYARRLETIRKWADREDVAFIEGAYEPEAWQESVGHPWEAGGMTREERCRACYRLRFEEAARHAVANGYDTLGTTLSVSPYQYTDAIREELEAVCGKWGLEAEFEDWRPWYENATRRSREAGMYRQNYCGCAISAAEAEAERAERKAACEAEKARKATERAEAEVELEKHREKRREYDSKKARQRAILKELRESAKSESAAMSESAKAAE